VNRKIDQITNVYPVKDRLYITFEHHDIRDMFGCSGELTLGEKLCRITFSQTESHDIEALNFRTLDDSDIPVHENTDRPIAPEFTGSETSRSGKDQPIFEPTTSEAIP